MRRSIAREMMDDDETIGTPAQWRQSLGDLARINLWLGGWHALRSELERLPEPPSAIVDVATGGADLPERVLAYLARRGRHANCVAVDRSARILGLAQMMRAGNGQLTFVQADARALPFADRSFDVATCNLALHHFDPPDATRVLRELARVGRSVIVNDLRRSWIAWAFARVVFPFFTSNPFTRNDGPISVRRAYTPSELELLARNAGWHRIDVRKQPGYRMTLAGGVVR
ncbi:MAG: methyltransferase domain-containing protein [Candidatus Eremiobacteraeota bacterium]|nr:methyltransferase domain-containing protein [Candidatus Eremiobacteraeota bacterium]MBV8596378.1 methyltransferase domain-containing protein [Candidatus Eremiobacteraeota bacterium]